MDTHSAREPGKTGAGHAPGPVDQLVELLAEFPLAREQILALQGT